MRVATKLSGIELSDWRGQALRRGISTGLPSRFPLADRPRASRVSAGLRRGRVETLSPRRTLSRFVDPTIALSFDRTGFRIHSLAFRPDDLDVDLSGRRCVGTGANSGIGYESAPALADLREGLRRLSRTRS